MRVAARRVLFTMRALVIVGLLLGLATAAHAGHPAPGPLRVTIECESGGRTKACPAFLLGFVEANQLYLSSPRAVADVIVYVTSNEVALVDRVHLRFVGKVAGAPPVVEVDVELDTRADDDTQRAQLQPAFDRGIALFVAAAHPEAVTVAIAALDGAAVGKAATSPYGIALSVSAFGNYTERFQSYNAFSSLSGSRLTKQSRVEASVWAHGGLNRQPPLELDDGTTVSLDTSQWGMGTSVEGAYLLCNCWSVGGAASVWRDDPKGQFRHAWNVKGGVEWDHYAADDPRGNRLAVLYYAGWQAEGYNLRNVLGERFAQFPIHGVTASGSVRKDKIGIGLELVVEGELIHPMRRHRISASPFVELKLGDHVDLSLNFSVTKRELPPPDESLIDPTDFETLSRLSFAEPFSLNGSFNLTVHWDRTNGARNDRFSDI
jgi:hypothetical protein